MSLPVVRLQASNRVNAAATDDPLLATATLYTFLRSLPTEAEVNVAMLSFLSALHTAPSSGAAAFHHLSNSRIVGALEAIAQDVFWSRPPAVLPNAARQSSHWRRRLGCPSTAPSSLVSSSSSNVESVAGEPSPPAVNYIRASQLKQYQDPYAAYEAAYHRQERRGRGAVDEGVDTIVGSSFIEVVQSPLGNDRQDLEAEGENEDEREAAEEAFLGSGGSTQAPEREIEAASASPLLSPSQTTAQTHQCESSRAASEEKEQINSAVHPVLRLVAEQINTTMTQSTVTEAATSSFSSPTPEAFSEEENSSLDKERFYTATRGKADGLRVRLRHISEQLQQSMGEQEAVGQVWTPYFSRLKTTKGFVKELSDRVDAADALFRLQWYEQQTIERAHVALMMEIMSLRLVLRDVANRVEEARSNEEERVENQVLLQGLVSILNSPAEEQV